MIFPADRANVRGQKILHESVKFTGDVSVVLLSNNFTRSPDKSG